jgi:hypothetical protein
LAAASGLVNFCGSPVASGEAIVAAADGDAEVDGDADGDGDSSSAGFWEHPAAMIATTKSSPAFCANDLPASPTITHPR